MLASPPRRLSPLSPSPSSGEVSASYADGGVMRRSELWLMTPPPPITGAPPQKTGEGVLAERQSRPLLHRAQREGTPDLGDSGDLGEVHDEALIGFEVGHDHAQEVIAVAGHQVAFHHLGP